MRRASRHAHQVCDAGRAFAPTGRRGFAGPTAQVCAVNLIERQWWHRAIEAELHERTGQAREIGLSSYPLRCDRIRGPENYDSFSRLQMLCNYIGISPVDWELIVKPDSVAQVAQSFCDGLSLRLVCPSV